MGGDASESEPPLSKDAAASVATSVLDALGPRVLERAVRAEVEEIEKQLATAEAAKMERAQLAAAEATKMEQEKLLAAQAVESPPPPKPLYKMDPDAVAAKIEEQAAPAPMVEDPFPPDKHFRATTSPHPAFVADIVVSAKNKQAAAVGGAPVSTPPNQDDPGKAEDIGPWTLERQDMKPVWRLDGGLRVPSVPGAPELSDPLPPDSPSLKRADHDSPFRRAQQKLEEEAPETQEQIRERIVREQRESEELVRQLRREEIALRDRILSKKTDDFSTGEREKELVKRTLEPEENELKNQRRIQERKKEKEVAEKTAVFPAPEQPVDPRLGGKRKEQAPMAKSDPRYRPVEENELRASVKARSAREEEEERLAAERLAAEKTTGVKSPTAKMRTMRAYSKEQEEYLKLHHKLRSPLGVKDPVQDFLCSPSGAAGGGPPGTAAGEGSSEESGSGARRGGGGVDSHVVLQVEDMGPRMLVDRMRARDEERGREVDVVGLAAGQEALFEKTDYEEMREANEHYLKELAKKLVADAEDKFEPRTSEQQRREEEKKEESLSKSAARAFQKDALKGKSGHDKVRAAAKDAIAEKREQRALEQKMEAEREEAARIAIAEKREQRALEQKMETEREQSRAVARVAIDGAVDAVTKLVEEIEAEAMALADRGGGVLPPEDLTDFVYPKSSPKPRPPGGKGRVAAVRASDIEEVAVEEPAGPLLPERERADHVTSEGPSPQRESEEGEEGRINLSSPPPPPFATKGRSPSPERRSPYDHEMEIAKTPEPPRNELQADEEGHKFKLKRLEGPLDRPQSEKYPSRSNRGPVSTVLDGPEDPVPASARDGSKARRGSFSELSKRERSLSPENFVPPFLQEMREAAGVEDGADDEFFQALQKPKQEPRQIFERLWKDAQETHMKKNKRVKAREAKEKSEWTQCFVLKPERPKDTTEVPMDRPKYQPPATRFNVGAQYTGRARVSG